MGVLCLIINILIPEGGGPQMSEGAASKNAPQKEQSFNKSEKTKDVRMTNIQAAKGT